MPRDEVLHFNGTLNSIRSSAGSRTVESGILVVIPVFNRARMIAEALDSVYRQSLRPSQVVVVDDGSTDSTAAVAEIWINHHRDLPVRLIKSPNRGAPAARNQGFAVRRKGLPFVAFLDSDDLWPRDFLERSAAALAKEPRAVLAVSDRIYVDVGGGKAREVSSRAFEADPFLQLIRVGAGYGSATLMRLGAFEATGGYSESVPTGHDILIFERLSRMGKCIHVQGDPVRMRTWRNVSASNQEPHIHLRYPDRYIRWAETYISVCKARLNEPGLNSHELRYHVAIAYRLLFASAVETRRMRGTQLTRILRNFGELAILMKNVISRVLVSTQPTMEIGE